MKALLTISLLLALAACQDEKPKTVVVDPQYWACTSAYISHHKEYCHSMKLWHCHDAYDSCECNQWTAYMVGKPHPADAKCSNDWTPAALRGVDRTSSLKSPQ